MEAQLTVLQETPSWGLVETLQIVKQFALCDHWFWWLEATVQQPSYCDCWGSRMIYQCFHLSTIYLIFDPLSPKFHLLLIRVLQPFLCKVDTCGTFPGYHVALNGWIMCKFRPTAWKHNWNRGKRRKCGLVMLLKIGVSHHHRRPQIMGMDQPCF